VAELPTFQAIADRGEIAVVAIGLDPPGSRDTVRGLLERLPIPTTLVISPAGRIETVMRGPVPHPR